MAFTNGQNVQAGDLNNFSVTTVTTTGNTTVGGNLSVTGTATVTGTTEHTGAVTFNANQFPMMPGRLTLTTATPVTRTDVTAATTLYYALYNGNQISLYTGSGWKNFTITELSIAVPGTTAQMYDVFVDYNSGTPILSLTAWTNDTTRATALAYQNGRLVLSGTATKLFIGCMRTAGVSGQTEDSYAKRYVWNMYNRVSRPLRVIEATNSWTYTTATIRQANGAAANQLDIINGQTDDAISVWVKGSSFSDTGGIVQVVGIGEDSTSAMATDCLISNLDVSAAGDTVNHFSTLTTIPAVGRHFYAWLEYSQASGVTTWWGDNGAATITQTGIHGVWRA